MMELHHHQGDLLTILVLTLGHAAVGVTQKGFRPKHTQTGRRHSFFSYLFQTEISSLEIRIKWFKITTNCRKRKSIACQGMTVHSYSCFQNTSEGVWANLFSSTWLSKLTYVSTEWQRWELNPRPSSYEHDELPLLYSAIYNKNNFVPLHGSLHIYSRNSEGHDSTQHRYCSISPIVFILIH